MRKVVEKKWGHPMSPKSNSLIGLHSLNTRYSATIKRPLTLSVFPDKADEADPGPDT